MKTLKKLTAILLSLVMLTTLYIHPAAAADSADENADEPVILLDGSGLYDTHHSGVIRISSDVSDESGDTPEEPDKNDSEPPESSTDSKSALGGIAENLIDRAKEALGTILITPVALFRNPMFMIFVFPILIAMVVVVSDFFS